MQQSKNQDEHEFGLAKYEVIRADESDGRGWLRNAPVCGLLKKHHISHSGVMDARHPFRVTRVNQNGTFMMACVSGRGQVLVDGRWEYLEEGHVCLLPPFVMNRFRCLPRTAWRFCWVRYSEARESVPIISSSTPVMGCFPVMPVYHAFQGLMAEVTTEAYVPAMETWIDLLQQQVMRFAQPQHSDERIVRMWRVVETDLSRAWTLGEMAGIAHVSAEHLRRLCQRHLGRSPLQHLTFLRMQRARHLLSSTSEKIDAIANAVGYESAFTFSNSFKKWVGWRPSENRQA